VPIDDYFFVVYCLPATKPSNRRALRLTSSLFTQPRLPPINNPFLSRQSGLSEFIYPTKSCFSGRSRNNSLSTNVSVVNTLIYTGKVQYQLRFAARNQNQQDDLLLLHSLPNSRVQPRCGAQRIKVVCNPLLGGYPHSCAFASAFSCRTMSPQAAMTPSEAYRLLLDPMAIWLLTL